MIFPALAGLGVNWFGYSGKPNDLLANRLRATFRAGPEQLELAGRQQDDVLDRATRDLSARQAAEKSA
jgi:hypothetical protein